MQQQCVDWSVVRSLPLHILTASPQSRTISRHVSSIASATRYQRGAQAACQAAKQRGSTYYERYLRNRKEKGGEFIGPPRGPLLLQEAYQLELQQQQQQQQQQNNAATPDSSSATATAAEAAGHLNTSLNPEQLSVFTPLGFKQLIGQCLLATAPSPVGSVKLLNPRTLQNPETQGLGQIGTQHRLQTQEPDTEATTQQQQQWLKEPSTFRDYVADDEGGAKQQSIRRKRGLTVQPPVVTTRPPLIPLPPIPSKHSSSSSSSIPRQRVLYVFWDICSSQPGGNDPRMIIAQLKRICSAYGLLHGIYAYGVQKQFSWVPEAFMLQYAPERLPGKSRRRQQQPAPQQQQQQQLESKLATLASAGVDLDEQLGPLRCPACGKLRNNYAQLHLHMVQRHKQPPPPLFKLLPEGALDVLLTQAGVQGANMDQQQQQMQLEGWTRMGGITSSSSGNSGGSSSSSSDAKQKFNVQFDAMTMQNNSTRTLGRVSRYYNSGGAQFEPPVGHQISLKYVLLREGVDIRLVQNQKRAIDVSLAEGLSQLLQQLLQKDADWAQQYDDTVMVLSDRGTHSNILGRFQKAGFNTVAVCRKIRKFKGADVTLRWQWLVDGRYDCENISHTG